MAKKEVIKTLPNPMLKREGIVEMCDGCDKVFGVMGAVCISYESPKSWESKGGCPLKSNKVYTKEELKKLNPIKASKMKYRRR